MTRERRAMERIIFRILAVVAAGLALYLLLPVCWNYLSPFIISIPIASMLQPLIRYLEEKVRMKHTAAVIIPVVLLIILVLVLTFWFLSYGIGQVIGFLQDSPTIISDTVSTIRTLVNRLLSVAGGSLPDSDVAWIRTATESLISWLSGAMANLASVLLSSLLNILAGVPYGFVYANFLAMAIYMITKDYHSIRSHLPGAPGSNPNRTSYKQTSAALAGLMGYLRMQTTYAVVSLVAGAIFWNAVGQRYAIVIALVAATLEFLPLLGNGTLYIPWGIISLLLGNTTSALEALGLYTVLLVIRRITEPKLLSHSTGISPLASLMGMFVGLRAGGLLGMIGGPVLATVLVSIWRGAYLHPAIEDVRVLNAWVRLRWAKVDEQDTAATPMAEDTETLLPQLTAEPAPKSIEEDKPS